jgi:hypothetical protein
MEGVKKISHGSIHNWGTKNEKRFKDFLELIFQNNIYMKQTSMRKIE